jgi:8-oxo-dGTP diphosphatase
MDNFIITNAGRQAIEHALEVGCHILNEDYNPDKPYNEGEVVGSGRNDSYNYIALKDVPANLENGIANAEYWALFSSGASTAAITSAAIAQVDIATHATSVFDGSYDQYAVTGATIDPSRITASTVYAHPVSSGPVCNYMVGAAVVIINEDTDEVLLMQRADADGALVHSLVGGKAVYDETMVETVARETAEETGLIIDLNRFQDLWIKEDVNGDRKFLTAYKWVTVTSEEAKAIVNREPDKCISMNWFTRDTLPENVWLHGREAIATAVTSYIIRSGFTLSKAE